MSVDSSLDSVPLHIQRAGEHLRETKLIMSVSADWAKVSAFYAAYHCVRAAMLQDPVFHDATRLAHANAHLTMASRTASHHNGNVTAQRGPGMIDIVRYLYRPFYSRYLQLHSASVSVRYEFAESVITAEECLQSAMEIRQALDAGELVH